MSTDRLFSRTLGLAVGAGLVGIGLILYVVTGSSFAPPGEAAAAAVRHSPHNPFLSLNQPLWEWVTGWIAAIPVGTLARRLGLFSAVCAAGTLALFWAMQWHLPFRQVDAEKQPRRALERARLISAGTGVGFLGVLLPFWTVANRAHPMSLNALLFMLVAALVVWFCRTGKPVVFYWAAFLSGVAGVEYAGFVTAFPLLGFAMLIAAMHWGHSRSRVMAKAVGCFLLGCLLLPASALWVLAQPQAAYQDLEEFRKVVALMWRDHLGMIVRSMPRTGWLLVGMTSVLPWMVVIPAALLGDQRAMRVKGSVVLLHLVLVVIAVGLIWNLNFAPWEVPGLRGTLILPCIFAASWVGYLAGHWYLVLGRLLHKRESAATLRASRTAIVAGVSILIVAAGVRNFSEARAEREGYVSRFADLVVSDLSPDSWVYGHGPFLHHLWLAAEANRKPLQTIDVSMFSAAPYIGYLGTLSDDPQKEYAASIGAEAYLREMLLEEDMRSRTAVIFFSDMLSSMGYEPIPDGMVYRPEVPDEELDPESLLEHGRRVWAHAERLLESAPSDSAWTTFFRTVLSQSANNLGILLQDLRDDTGGIEAYEQARVFKRDNISALLNLYGTAKRLDSVQFPAYEAELNEMMARGELGGDAWSLSARDGYVRSPFMFRDMGMAWALSGQRARAVQALERAEELGARGAGVRGALGALYMFDEDWEKSAEQFRIVLDNRPEHIGSLIGMGRLSVMRGDLAAANQYFRQAEEAGADFARIGLEMAVLRIVEGNDDLAEEILERLMDLRPDEPQPYLIMANMRNRQGDSEAARALLLSDIVRKSQSPSVLRSVGGLWAAIGDRDRARAALQSALASNELDRPTLELLLRMDLNDGQMGSAERHAKTLLTLDPDNALANFVFGLAHHVRGNLKVAEQCYRTSLRRVREAEALNNLAVILIGKGELDEARQLAEEAVDLRPEYAPAWDTLGTCHLEADRVGEAAEALERALDLEPDRPAAQLNMLDVWIRRGDMEAAGAMVRRVEGRLESLSAEQASRFDDLRGRVEEGAGAG